MGNYKVDDHEAPVWLNRKFFETVLENGEKDFDVKVKDFVLTPAMHKTASFSSIVFRATINYLNASGKEKDISIIIKTIPDEDGVKKDMLSDSRIFETESTMYHKTIVQFEEILRKYGDKTVLGARMLHHSLKPRQVIVLEDLTRKGYATIEKRMATMEEAKIVLEKIAMLHAVSFNFKNLGDKSISKYTEGVFNLPNSRANEIFINGIDLFIDLLKRLQGYEIYINKFYKIKELLISKSIFTHHNKGKFGVLNHGDLHVKNVMVKYNATGNLQDVMLVDFQLCTYSSAAIDLIYFLYMLIEFKDRLHHRDELIYFYYTRFVSTLQMIDYKGTIPTLAQLHIELIKWKHLDIFILTTFLPFMYAMASEWDVDPEKIMASVSQRSIFYTHPKYIEEVETILPQLLKKGYLDNLDE